MVEHIILGISLLFNAIIFGTMLIMALINEINESEHPRKLLGERRWW